MTLMATTADVLRKEHPEKGEGPIIRQNEDDAFNQESENHEDLSLGELDITSSDVSLKGNCCTVGFPLYTSDTAKH